MDAEAAREIAQRFVQFLETGQAPAGLFHPEAFCDYSRPTWRLQARGGDEVVRLRRENHPDKGSVPRWRCDPTPTGLVVEFEERWGEGEDRRYSREMARLDVSGSSIVEMSVYCTGDWEPATEDQHRREVVLLRP
jgi:hypothetical protein